MTIQKICFYLSEQFLCKTIQYLDHMLYLKSSHTRCIHNINYYNFVLSVLFFLFLSSELAIQLNCALLISFVAYLFRKWTKLAVCHTSLQWQQLKFFFKARNDVGSSVFEELEALIQLTDCNRPWLTAANTILAAQFIFLRVRIKLTSAKDFMTTNTPWSNNLAHILP